MRVLTQQPQSAIQIDWSNALTRNLVQATTPNFNDPVKGLITTSGVVTRVGSTRGLLYNFNGTDGLQYVNAEKITPPFTIAFDVIFSAVTANVYQTMVAQGGSGPSWGFAVNIAANALRFTFGGVADYTVASTTFTANILYRVCVTVSGNGGTATGYVNGINVGSVAVGTMNTPASTGTLIGTNAGGGRAANGTRIGNVALWNRALPAGEVKSFADNPWQIFKQNTVRDRLLNTLLADFNDINLEAVEPPITVNYGSFRQFGGLPTVNRNNRLGRSTTFLWSAANPTYDAADNFLATGIQGTAGILSAVISSEPPIITQTAEGATYTSTATPVSGGVGGGIVFAAKNSTAVGTHNLLRTGGDGTGYSIAILARYVSTAQNTRLFGFNNFQTSVSTTFGINFNGNPWLRTSSSYLQSPNAVQTDTTPYTLNKVHLTVYVLRTDRTDIYVDGKPVATTGNIHLDGLTVARLAIVPGGLNPIMISAFNKGLTRQEVRDLTENPWQLFKQARNRDRLLHTLLADFDDINAAAAEPAIPVPIGSTKQFLGQAMVNRGNQFGRNTQFLWSAATPRYDATDNYRATNSSDVTGLASAGIFGEPPNITATSEGLQYTSTATPVGGGTGGGIVFRGKNTSSATGDWVAQPAGRGNGITVVILGRYTSTASNQRLLGWTNQQNSGAHDTFQIVAGNPRIQYPNSYLRAPNFAGTTTVPYTLGQVHLTVYVASWQGQFFYVDGKLAGQSGHLHYGGSVGPSARLAIVPGGMAPIMIAVINKPLTRQEVRQLTANPWQLYRQPKIRDQLLHIYGTDFDTFNNFGKTSYVNYLDLPRNFTPVNRNHGLSKNMLFCWTPAHGTRDGYDPSVPVTGPGGPDYMDWVYGKYARYGHAVTPSRGYISRNFTAGSKTTTSNPLTLLAFVCINQNSYPIISRSIPSATDVLTTAFRVMAGNALSQFDFVILPDGQLSYGIPFVSGSYELPSGGPGGKVPLNTLVAVAVVVTSSQSRFFIDGRYVGSVRRSQGGNYLLAGANILAFVQNSANWSFPFIDCYLAAAWNRNLSDSEIAEFSQHPGQVFLRADRTHDQLTNTFIPDFTAELAPPSQLRSTYLTTASSSDKNNAITSQLLFASSPAHGNTDGANAKIAWSTSSDIKVVPGRGGLAWVYGRSQSSLPVADSFNKPINSTRWTMLSVLSLELDHVSQITPGHYFSGPSWGGNVGTGTRLQIDSNGKILLATTSAASIYADSVTITPRKVMVVAVTSDGTNTKFYLNGKLVHTSTTVYNTGGSVTYQPQRISFTDSVVGTGLRPWYVYLSAMWTRPLQEHEVAKLSQDPYQLFKRPESANQKLMHSLRYSETMPTEYYYYRHKPNYFVKPQNIGIIDYSNPVTRGLLVSWPMITAGNQVLDASNNRRHSNTMVTTDVSWTHDINGRQLTFTGSQTSGAVSWGDVSWLDGLTTASWEIDFVITNISNGAKLFAKWGGSFSILISVGSTGQISFIPHVGGSMRFWYSANGTISANTRYHLVIVWNGGNSASFFLNGVRGTFTTVPSSFSGGLNATTNNLQLGIGDDGTPLTGSIGMVNVWNRPLTDSEALDRYSKRWNIFQSSSRSLQGYIVERVIPYNEKPTYVNYTDLPKKYIPVNKAHPLAHRMTLCFVPVNANVDAFDSNVTWVDTGDVANSRYNQQRWDSWKNGRYESYGLATIGDSVNGVKRLAKAVGDWSSFTAVAFVYINQNTYPIIGEAGTGAIGPASRFLITGGYNDRWQFGITSDGRPFYGTISLGLQHPSGGPGGIVPLKKLVAVAITYTTQEAKFYIDGKYVGSIKSPFYASADPGIYVFPGQGMATPNVYGYLFTTWRYRVLSDQEIAEFSQHPGQIFQKQHLPREKLLERNFFTDLLPTYPSLPGITKLNRDDRGLYVPKFRVEPGRGAYHNPLNTPAQWWYPTPSSGIYISTFDTTSQKGIYAGYAEARYTPYGVGLKTSGNYEFGAPSLLGDVYASNSVTLVSLFYLQNAKQLTINGRVTALNHRSATSTSLFAQYTNDIGWTNWAGERRVLFAPNRGQYGTSADAEITGVANGLHCAVMHIDRASQQVTCYFDGKLVATKALGSNTAISYNGNFHYNSYFESLSANNIGSILFASQLIDQPFNSQQLSRLSKDPLPYFFKDSYQLKTDLLTKKLKYVETDANGIWTPYTRQPAYVNVTELPKRYTLVNKAHPLAHRMLFCALPANEFRDAYQEGLTWKGALSGIFRYKPDYKRGGPAWRHAGYSRLTTDYFSAAIGINSQYFTMLQFISIENDNYPVQGGIPLMGLGYTDNTHLRMDRWGKLEVSLPYYNQYVSFSGSMRVPLRKVVAVAAVGTPTSTSLYINGIKLGTSPNVITFSVGGDANQTPNAMGYNNSPAENNMFAYISAMWLRALSDQEIASLSQNPGQIFLHYEQFKRIYPEATPEEFFNKFFLFFG